MDLSSRPTGCFFGSLKGRGEGAMADDHTFNKLNQLVLFYLYMKLRLIPENSLKCPRN